MKPLFVLLISFCIAIFTIRFFSHEYDFPFAARIAISIMLVFTAIGHFAYSKGMMMMLPAFVPFKSAIVFFTGIMEITAAICLLIPGWQIFTGWFLICFFVLLLPANIYAAVNRIDYQKATRNGSGPGYLWFRIPLQILFIVWIYLSSIYL